jgi:ribosomal protein S18 acetylase RimI-like enzyme
VTTTLRRAGADDAAKLAALGALVWLHTYSTNGLNTSLAGYVLGRFTVKAKQALLAYATLHHGQACPGQHAARCELATLYVHPLFAGQGLGRQLLQQAHRRAGALWLSVWQHNTRAIAFYQAQGLQYVGDTVFELDGHAHRNLLLALG